MLDAMLYMLVQEDGTAQTRVARRHTSLLHTHSLDSQHVSSIAVDLSSTSTRSSSSSSSLLPWTSAGAGARRVLMQVDSEYSELANAICLQEYITTQS